MNYEDLIEILAEQFSCDPSELDPDVEFAELGADQEDLIELAWELEEQTGADITPADLRPLATIGALYRWLLDLEV